MSPPDLFSRPLVLLLIAVLTVVGGCRRGEVASDSRPASSFGRAGSPGPVPGAPHNVVLIVIDTLRSDHVGAYGSDMRLTPNIDRLAKRSLVFENAIATSSWTRPSVASMLTSRFPTTMKLVTREDGLAASEETLAEILRAEAGYQTVGIITNGNVGDPYGFAQGFDHYANPSLREAYEGDFPMWVAEGVTREAIRLLDDLDPARPFFLFLHYTDPHDPYLAHPGLLPTPEPRGRFDGSRRGLRLLRQTPEAERTAADYDRIRYLYSGEVKYCDLWIGAFLEELEARDLLRQSLIVLTADHGEGLWTHGNRGHGADLYEEMINIPLIIQLPDMDPDAATRIAAPVSLVDIAPTILAVNGITAPRHFQGSDLRLILGSHTADSTRDTVYSEMDLDGLSFRSLRGDHHKVIVKGGAEPRHVADVQLFDLASDPGEQRNLAGTDPDLQLELTSRLESWAESLESPQRERDRVALSDLDPQTLESLRALGYITDAERDEAASPARPVRDAGAAPAPVQAPRPAPDALSFYFSALDFSKADYPIQLARGISVVDDTTAVTGTTAAVVLKRQRDHSGWWIRGQLDPSLEPELPISISISVDGEEPSSFTLSDIAPLELGGPLPERYQAVARLDLQCRAALEEEAPTRSATRSCLRISAIGLD